MSMTGPELQEALDEIGWTRGELARRYGAARSFVDGCVWETKGIPERMQTLVEGARNAIRKVMQGWSR